MRIVINLQTLAVVVLATFPATAYASEVSEVLSFMKSNVAGRSFQCENQKIKISGGKQEAETEVLIRFSEIVETESGFYFDRFQSRKQINYDLNDDGTRTGKSYVKNSEAVVRYSLGATKCNGHVKGYSSDVYSHSTKPWPYSTELIQIRLSMGQLHLVRWTGLYGDLYGKNDQFRPGIVLIREIFEFDGTRVKLLNQESAYEIDQAGMDGLFESPFNLKATLTDELKQIEYLEVQ